MKEPKKIGRPRKERPEGEKVRYGRPELRVRVGAGLLAWVEAKGGPRWVERELLRLQEREVFTELDNAQGRRPAPRMDGPGEHGYYQETERLLGRRLA